ncbi:HTH_Tnp_Tc3_2 domain-containing protein [Trichonephila clavipes]|nr:HTH_Tnp_Tc3_2 domain-containing protein [Trichonephila clavipes]
MTQRMHWDDFLHVRIIDRLEYGRTQLEVSMGIAQSVMSRLWQPFQDNGNMSRRYSTDRPRITTPNEDRYLSVTEKRWSIALDMFRLLSSATVTTVSRQTVSYASGRLVYMFVDLSDVVHLLQLNVACS